MQRSLTALVVILFLTPCLLLAAAKEKKPRPFQKVDSVNVADGTVTITDTIGSNKTYTVDSFTVITVDGKPAKLSDVGGGLKAEITVGGGGKKLSRLEVSEPPDPDKKRKK